MASSVGAQLAVFASVVLLAACSAGPSTSGGATQALGGGNLNARISSDWNTLDPSGGSIPTTQAQSLILGLYDRLIATGTKGEVIPYLAKSWKQPDASTVIFKLRSDVTCTDGTPLTATAVAASLTRAFKSPGAATVFGGIAATATADDNARTVELKWPRPNADGFFGFTTSYASVICPAGLQGMRRS